MSLRSGCGKSVEIEGLRSFAVYTDLFVGILKY